MRQDVFIHESSYVDERCTIGAETKIWHFCHIQSGAVIGDHCTIGQNVNIAGGAVIGNRVKIQNNVSVYNGVILEDDVFCGPSMVFTNDLNPRAEFPKEGKYSDTLIQKGATIGANATILCGHTVGRYAMIGCGAVVTKDVPDYAIMKGNPARLSGYACKCGKKLYFEKNTAVCSGCLRQYIRDNSRLRTLNEE